MTRRLGTPSAAASSCALSGKAWIEHCAVADDCTLEESFCPCCAAHSSGTEAQAAPYAEACEVICAEWRKEQDEAPDREAASTSGFTFEEFSEHSAVDEAGPSFVQPALTLVGDAEVALGDCYHFDVRTVEDAEGAFDACLTLPAPERIFPADPRLPVSGLELCGATTAPFHLEDATAIVNLLCFAECAKRNTTLPPVTPQRANPDPLFIANCTRGCFVSCSQPAARRCTANCSAVDYRCFAACHAAVETCYTPTEPRDTRFYREDANEPICVDAEPAYEGCVLECHEGCHATLAAKYRTPQDDVHDWYRQSCLPPLELAEETAVGCTEGCVERCLGECDAGVRRRLAQVEQATPPNVEMVMTPVYGEYLLGCAINCSRACPRECGSPQRRELASAKCHPPEVRNCSATCYGLRCAETSRFCPAFDRRGDLALIDYNCSLGVYNASYDPYVANLSLAAALLDPYSAIAVQAGVNASAHTCFTECDRVLKYVASSGDEDDGDDASSPDMGRERFPGVLAGGRNCTTRCFATRCVRACEANCTLEAEYNALPACEAGPDCTGPYPQQCNSSAPCNWDKTLDLLDQPSINITQVTENQTTDLWVPPWTEAICEALSDGFIDAHVACAANCTQVTCGHCAFASNYTSRAGAVVGQTNDTSGVCMRECLPNCTAACAAVIDVDAACAVPPEPPDLCRPPAECISGCGEAKCFDVSYHLMTDRSCKVEPDTVGPNATVISLYYAYNTSSEMYCWGNASALKPGENCSAQLSYYELNVTEGNVFIEERCIRDCFGTCSDMCYEKYCVFEAEVSHDDHTCLPKCLQRHFDEAFAPPPPPRPNATGPSCLPTCLDNCSAAVMPGCALHCEPLLNPANWRGCVAECVARHAADCSRDCVFSCTANHTLAYGEPAPYDPSEDLLQYEAMWEAALSSPGLELMHQAMLQGSEWNNRTEACYANCSWECGAACFEEAGARCAPLVTTTRSYFDPTTNATVETTEPSEPASYEEVELLNNCTRKEAAPCLAECGAACITQRCFNLTDFPLTERQVARAKRHEQAALYDVYVESCEAKCRVQIYGRNNTRQTNCGFLYAKEDGLGWLHEQCMHNCSDAAALSCLEGNATFDATDACNGTCFFKRERFLVRTAAMRRNESRLAADGTVVEESEDDAPPPPPTAPAGGELLEEDHAAAQQVYDVCMEGCIVLNYTNNDAWRCDGGGPVAAALAEYVAIKEQFLEEANGEFTFHAEKALFDWRAEQPSSWAELGRQVERGTPIAEATRDGLLGQLCAPVGLECKFNASRGCDTECAEQVHKFEQLCYLEEEINISLAYNISSCIHPDGWQVGSPKYLWYAEQNASHPLATPPARIKRAETWSYDEVANGTVLNCTCHFENQTHAPAFVAKVVEWEMRPYRDHYVSMCGCYFNATEGEPQHCAHAANFSDPRLFDEALNDDRPRAPPPPGPNGIDEQARAFVECATPCLAVCYLKCGAQFVPAQANLSGALNNGSLVLFDEVQAHHLASYRVSNDSKGVAGQWVLPLLPEHEYDLPQLHDLTCLAPCIHECSHGAQNTSCASRCTQGCDPMTGHPALATDGNQTAADFACTARQDKRWGASPQAGQPYCDATCECHAGCVDKCVRGLGVNETSAEHAASLPPCLTNCSRACGEYHRELCVNISITRAYVPPVNETHECITNIWPTCAFHCLGIAIGNVTSVNHTTFPPSEIPIELRTLNLLGDAQGYECELEDCDPFTGNSLGLPCNSTTVKVDEKVVRDPLSGNRTIVPIFRNASFDTYQGCVRNRSSACLAVCYEVGDRVCFPPTEPFDLCVRSCVANLTYVPEPLVRARQSPEACGIMAQGWLTLACLPAWQVFDHSVAVCKKELRLTPSEQGRAGAAWFGQKQPVLSGFDTSFAFRLAHPSRRCTSDAHPSHEERPEALDEVCEFGGGDGFAFVIQDDARMEVLEADCAFNCLHACQTNATDACYARCLAPCQAEEEQAGAECLAQCLTGGGADEEASEHADAEAEAQVVADAEAEVGFNVDCPAFAAECVARCLAQGGGQLYNASLNNAGLPHGPVLEGGCLFECIAEQSRAGYCQDYCPLVDEDLDMDCIEACAMRRVAKTKVCVQGCAPTCAPAALAGRAACTARCDNRSTPLPSGQPLGECLGNVEARRSEEDATCLSGCRSDDPACWAACLDERAPYAVAACWGACAQNDTACGVECLAQRGGAAAACALPCLAPCPVESRALGQAANGVGLSALRNVLGVKFDTWFDPDSSEPHRGHVAVHASGSGTATHDAARALALAYPAVDIADGAYHTARIVYTPDPAPGVRDDAVVRPETTVAGSAAIADIPLPTTARHRRPSVTGREHQQPGGHGVLRVLVDEQEVLSAPLSLDVLLRLPTGQAYVGFTGATGQAYQEHKIVQWRFTSVREVDG